MGIVTWFNVHLWAPMWPNIFAPSFITLMAVVISHVKIKEHQRKNHEAQMKALSGKADS